ncbi:ROK family protein [Venenivibrio stagnispumantis]|uniref:Glucokinase n=1 Tax=Venenivibrio stagnispumantis TaxID=407998 RepID=A0AA45WKP9_9AQUI|nr:ROK family protein [Venenivibrio stagnispumantis]MCW4572989.1 ROK family protein [Venenivibrio stagnispumantis]SMP07927.1 glucokinase [Venenivibrio stagnispumantis]
MKYLGLDIGGTFLKYIFKDGENIEKDKIYIRDFFEKNDLKGFIDILNKVISLKNPDKIGIAVAGLVDKKNNKITNSPNLKMIESLDLSEYIQTDIIIENDANAAAYGEYKYGIGKNSNIFICLTLGTGLGGGVVINGKLISGVSGSAMEVGHITVEKDGWICHCGRKGCLESYVSSYGLERFYCLLTDNKKSSFEIINLAKEKDINAIKSIDYFTDYLSIGIMNLTHIFNPDIIAIAGGIVENYPDIINITKEKVKNLIFPLPLRDLRIEIATLGEYSGAYGALAIAQDYYS